MRFALRFEILTISTFFGEKINCLIIKVESSRILHRFVNYVNLCFYLLGVNVRLINEVLQHIRIIFHFLMFFEYRYADKRCPNSGKSPYIPKQSRLVGQLLYLVCGSKMYKSLFGYPELGRLLKALRKESSRAGRLDSSAKSIDIQGQSGELVTLSKLQLRSLRLYKLFPDNQTIKTCKRIVDIQTDQAIERARQIV